jgi:hypothetical protein
LDEEPIPDSLRFLVLKAAGGRCQLCGIPKAIEKNGSVFAVEDNYPATPGHLQLLGSTMSP